MLPGSQVTTAEWFETRFAPRTRLSRPPESQGDGDASCGYGGLRAAPIPRRSRITSYTITTLPDQALELNSQFHSTGSRNYGKFSDPEADTLLEKALSTIDPAARSTVIKRFQARRPS